MESALGTLEMINIASSGEYVCACAALQAQGDDVGAFDLVVAAIETEFEALRKRATCTSSEAHSPAVATATDLGQSKVAVHNSSNSLSRQ